MRRIVRVMRVLRVGKVTVLRVIGMRSVHRSKLRYEWVLLWIHSPIGRSMG